MVIPGDFTKGHGGATSTANSFGSQFANSLMQPFTDDSYYSTYNSWKAAVQPAAATAAAATANFAKSFPWGLGAAASTAAAGPFSSPASQTAYSPYTQSSSYAAAAYAAAAASTTSSSSSKAGEGPFQSSCSSNSIASLRLKAKQHYESDDSSFMTVGKGDSFMTAGQQQQQQGDQQVLNGEEMSPRSNSTNSGSPMASAATETGCYVTAGGGNALSSPPQSAAL